MSSATNQRQKIHPHKLLMWIAIASICMMFGGWTSAFLVRKAQGNWMLFTLPYSFWASTMVVIVSSLTMHRSVVLFKNRNMPVFRKFFTLTTILAVVFMALQFMGFYEMHRSGILLNSTSEGVSGGFIYVISGVHLAHMLGGVIALVIYSLVLRYRKRTRVYSSTGLEILATYWHFVDILWIYLFVFFLLNQK
jgi:Heme/copper-type cytochrome/quinol oxidase, subunit 3